MILFEKPRIEIINGDCMEGMAAMKDNEFDLAITDPPFGIGSTWSKSREDRFYKKGKLHKYQNDAPPGKEYFSELFRSFKNQIIWGGNYYTNYLPVTNSWVVWNKMHGDNKFMSDGELAWTSFKKPLLILDLLWDGARKCEDVDKIHPHQKPVQLYKWLLKNYAKEGDTILDTHMGSGSSALACYEMGFDYTGYEIDAEYFDAAKARIRLITSQSKLF